MSTEEPYRARRQRPSTTPATRIAARPTRRWFTYALVSNGKSTGQAFTLQVLDPTGKVKTVQMAEGLVVEPLKRGSAQPLPANAAAGGSVVSQALDAFCLEFNKQAPAAGTLYRIADAATQQKFAPVRAVMQAARELAHAGKLHPDSDPAQYFDAIRQYAMWTKIENWSENQFADEFVARTHKNADELKVKWTKQMEDQLRAAVPNRWKDITDTIAYAQFLEQSARDRGQAMQAVLK